MRVIATASKEGNLYYLNCINVYHTPRVCVAEDNCDSVWHRRYGHLGEKYLQQLAKEKLVDGFNYDVQSFVNRVFKGNFIKLNFLAKRENEL